MSNAAIADNLVTALQSRSATIDIIGLGYVGLPLALRYAEAGYPGTYHSKALRGSRVLMLGVAYKKNVDDMRESPSALIREHARLIVDTRGVYREAAAHIVRA